MSSSKNYQRYATSWLTLFDAFLDDPTREIKVECPDERAAQSMRLEFYKARTAFLADEGMNEQYGEVLNSREVTYHGNFVFFENKDKTWMGKSIEAAVKK